MNKAKKGIVLLSKTWANENESSLKKKKEFKIVCFNFNTGSLMAYL